MPSDEQRAAAYGEATKSKMRQFVARIERLEAEKSDLVADIREIYAEIKTFGLDAPIIRKVVAARKKDADERAEEGAVFDLYIEIIGEA